VEKGALKSFRSQASIASIILLIAMCLHSGMVETWRVNCYSFRGDHQIGGPRTRSGYGNNTPASAYQ
jgi:hypothetical protein